MSGKSPEHACLQHFSDALREAAENEICTDMHGYAASQALLAKVPEVSKGGWNAISHPKKPWLRRSYPQEKG
jgi:hypothetical protein